MNSAETPAKTLANYKKSLLFYKTALANVEKALEEMENNPSVELQKTREKIQQIVAGYESMIAKLETYVRNQECRAKTRNNCSVMGGKYRSKRRRSKSMRKRKI
jgi:hypothetical protein